MGIFLWLPSLAFSFQPSDHVWLGSEPSRTQHYNVERQYILRHHPAWDDFVADDGNGWHAQFDELTGLAYRAWGPPIWLGQTDDPLIVEQQIRTFIHEHPNLFQAKTSSFMDVNVAFQSELDSWLVEAQQYIPLSTTAVNDLDGSLVQSAPVWRGKARFRIRSGWLNWFGAQHLPESMWSASSASISASDAVRISQIDGPHVDSVYNNVSAELVYLPQERAGTLVAVLVWKIESETLEPRGIWTSFVDAESGELITVYNSVRYLDGALSAEHDTRTVDGEFSVSALSYLSNGGIETDSEGLYSSDENGAAEVRLSGLYTNVLNATGDNAVLQVSGGEQIFDTSSATQAELDQYIYQNRIYEWAEEHAPHVVANWPRSQVNVNINDSCNAYFDGTLNFFSAGNGCNNTGRIADVSYHEWGHGFHYYNLLSGEYDGAMSEGISDTVAFLQTESPYIAPYFGTNGSAIREVSNDRVYPDDIVNQVHTDGLIFAGAMWDLWELMEGVYPAQEAYDQTTNIFVQGLRSGPTIPESFDAMLLADDDNNDLSDGTPNQCTLVEAFGRHGLGFNGGEGLVTLAHVAIGNQSANSVEYVLEGDVLVFAEACTDADIDSVEVFYSTDSGNTWLDWPLTLSGDQLTGAIPAVDVGQVVQYYIQAQDTDGGATTVPSGGSINPFSFYVGELEEIYCTDFESDDGGFTHELLSGEDQEGADDWMWGTPLGLSGDPSYAASGVNVWGNDLGGGNYNGAYQADKWNRLNSPDFDVAAYNTVLLSYQRWLNVEDGFYDQAQITANGVVVWGNHTTVQSIGDEHHEDQQWAPHAVLLPTGGSEQISFGWEIISDGGLEFGGWTIDDVCVYGVIPPEDQSGSGSDNADGEDFGKDDLFVGCGCASTSAPETAWLFGLGLIGFILQRRRD